MLAPPAKRKRSFELIQVILTFISVCALAEASAVGNAPPDGPGFHAPTGEQDGATRDRRFADLARVERKRREAEQRAHRRSPALALVAGAIDARDASPSGTGSAPSLHSSICASCRISETASSLAKHRRGIGINGLR